VYALGSGSSISKPTQQQQQHAMVWQQQPNVDSTTKLKPPAAVQEEGRFMRMLMKVGGLAACCCCCCCCTSCAGTNMCNRRAQVANQRWLTVGAIIFVGGAGLLAADAVSTAHTLLPSANLPAHTPSSLQRAFCAVATLQTAELLVGRFQQDDDDD
jgi:hypothetical protein